MAEVLSQSQIDELLNNLTSGDIDIKEIETQESKIKEYDFKSPKKVTKETIKLLKGVYESYCRVLSSFMTSKLRLICDITVEEVEETRFFEYTNALDEYTLMGLADVNYPDETSSESQIILEVSKSLSFMIIDRLLGGDGEELENLRDYTDVEIAILGNLLKEMIEPMGRAWESAMELDIKLGKCETNSRFIQAVNYTDTVVVLVLKADIKGIIGKIALCIPFSIIEEINKKSAVYLNNNRKKNGMVDQKEIIMNSLRKSNLNITGVLGKTELCLKDILDMKIGDVITLDRGITSDIDVTVDGELWFTGKLGTKKNKNVVKINKILD